MNTDIFNEMLKKASYGTGVIKPCIDEIEPLRQQLDAANTLIKKYREEMSQEQLDNRAAHQRSVEEKEMIEKYLRDFMAQQNGLPATPLVEAGLVYAGGPNNTWALTELGVEMLNGEGPESVEDVVNHPAHYNKGGIECINAVQAALTPEEFRGYCKGNALKYIWRNGKKAPGTEVQDAEKAIWYLAKFNDTF